VLQKILGLLEGNHELRAYEQASVNVTHRISRELNIRNLGVGAVFYIHVNNEGTSRGQNYGMYVQHGASGARTAGGKLNAVVRMREIIANLDLYMMGHLHTLDHHTAEPFVMDRGILRLLTQHFVITGSYMKYTGSYAQRKGYPPAGKLGSARIGFHTDEHLVSVKI